MNELGSDTVRALTKVELGCGRTKTPGYIGLDRFALPGVDIVTDLNVGIPLDDDSVDVILACNSLEHLDNLLHTMEEIYRVCRHGAILHILSPYYEMYTNLANIYHKQVFNEDTFRFFSCRKDNPFIDPEEWYCPHASIWGLGSSDNSEMNMEFHLVGMEFFYYKEYRHLNAEQKRHARRAFHNVCDQVFYTLIVDKSGNLTDAELRTLSERAKLFEPSIIQILRARDSAMEPGTSVLTDIEQNTENRLTQYAAIVDSRFIELDGKVNQNRAITDATAELTNSRFIELDGKVNRNQAITDAAAELTNSRFIELDGKVNRNQAITDAAAELANSRFIELDGKLVHQYEETESISGRLSRLANQTSDVETEAARLKNELEQLRAENIALRSLQEIVNRNNELRQFAMASYLRDLILQHSPKRSLRQRLWLVEQRGSMRQALSSTQPGFLEALLLQNDHFGKHTALLASELIPFNGYLEYSIKGWGERINYFLFGIFGSRYLAEVVLNGKIVAQQTVTLEREGEQSIVTPEIKGEAFLRLRSLDAYAILRALELSNRKLIFFSHRELAAYIN